jgi:hypothetical protein
MKESELLKSATDWLQLLQNQEKLVFQRNNSFAGMILRKNKTTGYIKNAKRGAGDLIIFLPNGKYLFAEAKSAAGKQSEDQKLFEEKITKLGGNYVIFRSFEALKTIIDIYLKN